jgi:hypothetical protein
MVACRSDNQERRKPGAGLRGRRSQSHAREQIFLETEGINKYKNQIESVDDPEVVGVLKHIL